MPGPAFRQRLVRNITRRVGETAGKTSRCNR
jgi:hypothetical protein